MARGINLTSEDFERWLTPSLAVELVARTWPEETRCRWLLDRLKTGIIQAVAESGPDAARNMASFVDVPRNFWTGLEYEAEEHFWTTGDVTFKRGGLTGYGDAVELRYLNVRLNPGTIRSGIHAADTGRLEVEPNLAEHSADEEKSDLKGNIKVGKPRLSDAALAAWHSAFLLAYPNGTQTLAIQSATAAFPNHSVSRERIRELFPDVQRGRPKKTDT